MINAHDASETLPCGCIVTLPAPGHRHTKLCALHRQEAFAPRGAAVYPVLGTKPEWDDV